MVKKRDMVNLFGQMEKNIEDNGLMIKGKGTAYYTIKIIPLNMKVNLRIIYIMVMENIILKIKNIILDILRIMNLMEKGNIIMGKRK